MFGHVSVRSYEGYSVRGGEGYNHTGRRLRIIQRTIEGNGGARERVKKEAISEMFVVLRLRFAPPPKNIHTVKADSCMMTRDETCSRSQCNEKI